MLLLLNQSGPIIGVALSTSFVGSGTTLAVAVPDTSAYPKCAAVVCFHAEAGTDCSAMTMKLNGQSLAFIDQVHVTGGGGSNETIGMWWCTEAVMNLAGANSTQNLVQTGGGTNGLISWNAFSNRYQILPTQYKLKTAVIGVTATLSDTVTPLTADALVFMAGIDQVGLPNHITLANGMVGGTENYDAVSNSADANCGGAYKLAVGTSPFTAGMTWPSASSNKAAFIIVLEANVAGATVTSVDNSNVMISGSVCTVTGVGFTGLSNVRLTDINGQVKAVSSFTVDSNTQMHFTLDIHTTNMRYGAGATIELLSGVLYSSAYPLTLAQPSANSYVNALGWYPGLPGFATGIAGFADGWQVEYENSNSGSPISVLPNLDLIIGPPALPDPSTLYRAYYNPSTFVWVVDSLIVTHGVVATPMDHLGGIVRRNGRVVKRFRPMV